MEDTDSIGRKMKRCARKDEMAGSTWIMGTSNFVKGQAFNNS
jgi:hypothetical protein